MDDFVFGSLSTTAKRIEYLQDARRGIRHRSQISPRSPRPADSVQLTVQIGLPQRVEKVVCKVIAPETAVYSFKPTGTDWDLLTWQYVQTWQANLLYGIQTSIHLKIFMQMS